MTDQQQEEARRDPRPGDVWTAPNPHSDTFFALPKIRLEVLSVYSGNGRTCVYCAKNSGWMASGMAMLLSAFQSYASNFTLATRGDAPNRD